MTAFYMFRMWFLLFTGPSRGWSSLPVGEQPHGDHGEHHHEHPAEHAHESGLLIAVPLIVLASRR